MPYLGSHDSFSSLWSQCGILERRRFAWRTETGEAWSGIALMEEARFSVGLFAKHEFLTGGKMNKEGYLLPLSPDGAPGPCICLLAPRSGGTALTVYLPTQQPFERVVTYAMNTVGGAWLDVRKVKVSRLEVPPALAAVPSRYGGVR
ncbi:hypothetical protein LZ31DRAFT_314994 [Colletotrichum somersetense]|nr:hypothetical protein LZ31DRAFT_314994 [Colletotrichum somersetense]